MYVLHSRAGVDERETGRDGMGLRKELRGSFCRVATFIRFLLAFEEIKVQGLKCKSLKD